MISGTVAATPGRQEVKRTIEGIIEFPMWKGVQKGARILLLQVCFFFSFSGKLLLLGSIISSNIFNVISFLGVNFEFHSSSLEFIIL